jgi:hypothetical protein
VLEPTSNLDKIAEQLRTGIPNAVTMEKSSMDCTDYNTMFHNALTNITQKIRTHEAAPSTNVNQSSFLRVEGKCKAGGTRSGKAGKHTIDIREFFTAAAERDNILALAADFFSVKDHVHVLCACKSALECNVDRQEARLNCNLLFGVSPQECGRYAASIGNQMMDQFEPWYFGVAFAFCFKYCSGMPDLCHFGKVRRHRRKEAAPQVDLQLWSKIITRRCEKALSNSWDLGFCLSSLLFRSKLNMSRSLYAFENEKRAGGGFGFTPQELEGASIDICNALSGTYKDARGRTLQVKGDLSKVHLVKKLSEPSKIILGRVHTVAQNIEGTNEVRTLMRYDTHAFRIAHGVPLFVTVSPDEKHNLLMLRFSRARRNDPAVNVKGQEFAKKYGAIDEPPLDDLLSSLSVKELRDRVPPCDQRRSMISRDALACVDGFRTIVQLFMEYFLGMRCCIDCPNCACADLFGSNARPEGGFLGRVDSVYGSIEAQKSAGSLHVHFQVFVQCLHQHTPLHTLLQDFRSTLPDLFNDYAKYKAHVCRQKYEDPDAWKARQSDTESAWKTQYESSVELLETPEYLKTAFENPHAGDKKAGARSSIHSEASARKWLQSYLASVQRRQEMRQNHVHVWNAKKKCKMPLTHCQSSDNPAKCKAFFPRTKWLVEKTLVLCKGFLNKQRHAIHG